jgi:hypothetical protein
LHVKRANVQQGRGVVERPYRKLEDDMRHAKQKKRKLYGTWRCSPEDYQAMKKHYHDLQRQFKVWGKSAQRDHFELLESFNTLRYHPVIQFLMWLRIVPRVG